MLYILYAVAREGRSTDEGSIAVPRGGSSADVKPAVLFILSDTAKSERGDLRDSADIPVKYRRRRRSSGDPRVVSREVREPQGGER